ncbi:MAG: nitroreductase family protein [Candidatus Hodarchaeota archaeon]
MVEPDLSEFMLNLIKERHAIRDYLTDQQVSDELLYKIIEAGGYAPSAENQQPWRVIIVRDREKQRRIGELAVQRTIELFGRITPRQELERRLGYVKALPSRERTIDWLITGRRFEYIKGEPETDGAPLLFVLAIEATHVGNSQATLRGTGGVYGWSSQRHAVIAGSMFMQNCWLAATALGLGACVSSVQLDHYDDVREISELLGIPHPHWLPILCLTIGYPKYPRVQGPPRLSPEEITYVDTWGNNWQPQKTPRTKKE